ncbi:MAG: orotidine 5'-phosphate decarboxylase [Chloroflexota bacterium]
MKKPKLQLALDLTDLDAAVDIAKELHAWWDILEVGTALLLSEGLKSVEKIRGVFPVAVILADTKIIDSGKLLAETACKAGADIITVVSAASNTTINESVAAAKTHSSKVLLDHLSANWQSDELVGKSKLGVDLVGLHMPKDVQSVSKFDFEAIETIAQKASAELSIAGNITPDKVTELAGLPIHVFVVGGYLLKAENKKERAKQIKQRIIDKENYQNGKYS